MFMRTVIIPLLQSVAYSGGTWTLKRSNHLGQKVEIVELNREMVEIYKRLLMGEEIFRSWLTCRRGVDQ